MAYRLLLDENFEHVDDVPELGKGVSDERIAAYSTENERIVLTYDDDFKTEFDAREYFAVFYVPEQSLPPGTVAAIVDTISEQYTQEDLVGQGVQYLGTEWL